MPRFLSGCCCFLLLVVGLPLQAQNSDAVAETPAETAPEAAETARAEAAVQALDQPLYSPFVERYVLDELKQLRTDMANQKHELMQQVVDREHRSVDRAVSYATDTITYFFYLIAAASSILVLVGWSSIRDIKERVHTFANDEISKLVNEYEERLGRIESQLRQKTRHIERNREEIELTQEVQSMWLRTQQEQTPGQRIPLYDQILKLRPDDCEALTYKADAVLELDEPQWAANLCQQALALDPENSHAFYQLACAHTALHHHDEAIRNLSRALDLNEAYREQLESDPALKPLYENEQFKILLGGSL